MLKAKSGSQTEISRQFRWHEGQGSKLQVYKQTTLKQASKKNPSLKTTKHLPTLKVTVSPSLLETQITHSNRTLISKKITRVGINQFVTEPS